MGLPVVTTVIVVITAVAATWLFWRINQEAVRPLILTNSAGTTGKALLVYHPGLSTFPEQVTTNFVSGLVASGWQVSTATASSQAPLPDDGYDLVIFGAPVYFGAPAKPLTQYITRVGDLGGKPVVILLTGADDVAGAIAAAEKAVIEAKGRPIRSLGFTTMKPNDKENKYAGSNIEKALQIAREGGRNFALRTQ